MMMLTRIALVIQVSNNAPHDRINPLVHKQLPNVAQKIVFPELPYKQCHFRANEEFDRRHKFHLKTAFIGFPHD